MGLKLITAPSVEPLTLADAYAQCQVDLTGSPPTSAHDDFFNATIPVVRQHAENELARALVTQTWELWLEDFPRALLDDVSRDGSLWTGCVRRYPRRHNWKQITVPLPPLQSVTSIKYLDTTGALQTLDPTLYIVDTSVEPAKIVPAVGQCWPDVQCQPGAVKIRFVAGYAPTSTGSPPVYNYRANIPPGIRHWMLLMLGNWLRNREASWQQVGSQVAASAPYVDQLLFPFRVLNRDV
jgi:hypothetical protein